VYDQARTRRTVLPHVPEGAIDNMRGYQVKVFGVIEHNRWILAAAFEHDLLQVGFRRVPEKATPGFGRAGK